jgi:hypothetical protein
MLTESALEVLRQVVIPSLWIVTEVDDEGWAAFQGIGGTR